MLKKLFFILIVKPLIVLGMGLHIRGREHLTSKGPCIIAANHNSHLDTLILMSLFPVDVIVKIRPVAAADYFMKNRYLRWFALKIMGIIPMQRQTKNFHEHPLEETLEALQRGEIVIIFPEGSRGVPEQMGDLKKGVGHLVKSFPNVPVVPVNIYGAGKSLPRGEALFVPFIADVSIGEPLYYDHASVSEFTQSLAASIASLSSKNQF